MELKKLKLTEIKPYGKNPRKNDGAVDAVADYQNERWKAKQREKAKAEKGWQNYTDTWKEVETMCKDCPAWSGTDCTRNPYTDGCLKDKGGKDE